MTGDYEKAFTLRGCFGFPLRRQPAEVETQQPRAAACLPPASGIRQWWPEVVVVVGTLKAGQQWWLEVVTGGGGRQW